MTAVKDLAYYKANAEEDYLLVPISVLRYISQLEQEQDKKLYSEEEVEKLIRITYQETMREMVDLFKNNKDKTPQDAESAISNYVYPRLSEKGIKFKNK